MFQKIRTVLFWLHLVLGVLGGIFIFCMSVSGTLIAFEKQIIAWMESGQRYVTVPAGGVQLEPEVLIAKVQEAKPNLPISGLTMFSDPALAARFNTGGRGSQGQLYVNPYTAEITGEGDNTTRGVFRFLISFHRWFALPNTHIFVADDVHPPGQPHPISYKDVGEWVNAIAVLMFLVIILTGVFIWIPRRWTWRALKPITTFDTSLKGKARDWNWHNVLGIWSLPVILFITLTGTVIAHTWAGNLLYTLTGNTPPAPRGAGAPGGAGGPGQGQSAPAQRTPRAEGGEGGEPRGRRNRGEGATADGRAPRTEGAMTEGGSATSAPAAPAPRGEGTARAEGGGGEARASGGKAAGGPAPKINVTGQNAMWAAAKKQVAGWQFISLQLSANPRGDAEFTIDRGNGTQPYLTDTLTLNRSTAAVEKWAPYDSQNAGQKLRRWARFGHTGEAFGLFGQFIAFLGALATAVLVYTGIFLTWRRFFGKHITTPPTKASPGTAATAAKSKVTADISEPASAVAAERTPSPAKS
ncbi:MAG TPA: PepSY-associated TM helix domain-containing protein [Candidatus Methylacidiphilales bacterium]|nr:PepSY-associated TM helix domain-containing protein [Candidatus Methylacidiphilales bacterium]